MIPEQTEPLQGADEDEAMGLHIFDSRDMMEGTQDIDTLDTDRAADENLTMVARLGGNDKIPKILRPN